MKKIGKMLCLWIGIQSYAMFFYYLGKMGWSFNWSLLAVVIVAIYIGIILAWMKD